MNELAFAVLITVTILLLFYLLMTMNRKHEGMMADIYQANARGITASSATAEYERAQKLGGYFPSLGITL